MKLIFEHLVDNRLYQVWRIDGIGIVTHWVPPESVERVACVAVSGGDMLVIKGDGRLKVWGWKPTQSPSR